VFCFCFISDVTTALNYASVKKRRTERQKKITDKLNLTWNLTHKKWSLPRLWHCSNCANNLRQFRMWNIITVVVVVGMLCATSCNSCSGSRLVMSWSIRPAGQTVCRSILIPILLLLQLFAVSSASHPPVSHRFWWSHPGLWIQVKATSKEVDKRSIITVSQDVSRKILGAWRPPVLSPPRSSPSQLNRSVLAITQRAITRIALWADKMSRTFGRVEQVGGRYSKYLNYTG